jgi:hypothetical protein
MKPLQASFTSGELSPLLHARADLARYTTGAAKLENFIVLPQGGIARRPAFSEVLSTGTKKLNLVPFRFSSEDTALLGFDGTANMVVIRGGQEPQTIAMTAGEGVGYSQLASPSLRYAQSGNMIFFAGGTPCTLTRAGADDWRLELLDITDGPWKSGTGKKNDDENITVYFLEKGLDRIYASKAGADDAYEAVAWSSARSRPIRLDLQMGGEIKVDSVPARQQGYHSAEIVAKGTWEFITSGKNWAGTVRVQKSLDNGKTWYTVKASTKAMTDDGTNIHLTGTETEEDVLYRIQIDMDKNDGAAMEGFEFLVPPFVRSLVFRAVEATNQYEPFDAELLTDTHGVDYMLGTSPEKADKALDWRLGAGYDSSELGAGVSAELEESVRRDGDAVYNKSRRKGLRTLWRN